MKKFVQVISFLALSIFVSNIQVFGSPQSEKATAEIKVLRIAHDQNSENPRNVSALYFKDLVEKSSNGSLKVEVYHSGQLGNERELVEALAVGGGADLVIAGAQFSAYAPAIQLIEMPYLFGSPEQAYKFLDGPMGAKLAAPLLQNGIRLLSYWENGFRHITNNVRPIDKPEDLKGLKLRTPQSKMRMMTFQAFGTNPMPIAFTELYIALSQGVVDGQENPLSNIMSAKFYEVQKYLSLTGHIYSANLLCIRDAIWNKLTDDQKKIVADAAIKSGTHNRNLIQASDKKLRDLLAQQGMSVNTPTSIKPFQEIAKRDIWPLFEETVGKDIVKEVIAATEAAQ